MCPVGAEQEQRAAAESADVSLEGHYIGQPGFMAPC